MGVGVRTTSARAAFRSASARARSSHPAILGRKPDPQATNSGDPRDRSPLANSYQGLRLKNNGLPEPKNKGLVITRIDTDLRAKGCPTVSAGGSLAERRGGQDARRRPERSAFPKSGSRSALSRRMSRRRSPRRCPVLSSRIDELKSAACCSVGGRLSGEEGALRMTVENLQRFYVAALKRLAGGAFARGEAYYRGGARGISSRSSQGASWRA